MCCYGGGVLAQLILIAATSRAAASAALAVSPVGASHLTRPHGHDVSAPLRLLRPVDGAPPRPDREPLRVSLPDWPAAARDPAVQANPAPLPLLLQSRLSFDGIGDGFLDPQGSSFKIIGDPPDPQGDVSHSHYVQLVNSSFAVFSKQGELLFGPVPTRTLFAGFGGPCEVSDDGDGIVLYDQLADRWIVSQLAIVDRSSGPFLECVAVSRTSDPTGSYARYSYAYPFFNDYPKLGVWPDAYYATYNKFTTVGATDFLGVEMCAFDRASMLAGTAANQQCVELGSGHLSGTTPADVDGAFGPLPGEPGMALGFAPDSLVLYRYFVDWIAPERSYAIATPIPVAPFIPACDASRTGACVPQSGAGSSVLDVLSDRMMFRVVYRNFGDREVLIANHTVRAGTSSGVRWYELRDPGGDPFVFQQGTYAPDDRWRWMGSAAIDGAGNIGLGFSLSDAQQHPAIAFTGRTPSDPPGVMAQGEGLAFAGGGSQGASVRWGDYSNLSVDPADDCTFWYSAEYLPADGLFKVWHTRVNNFVLPACASPLADFGLMIAPQRQTVALLREATFSVRTAALRPTAAGKTIALTLSALPPGISGRIEPTSLAPGQTATLTLAALGNAALGEVAFGVQGAAADVAVSAAGQATVIANDFSMKVSAINNAILANGTTPFEIVTEVAAGEPEAIAFSASRLPKGVTATFQPSSVLAGSPAILLLGGSPALRAGQSEVLLRGTTTSTSHTLPLRVLALLPPTADIAWPRLAESLSGTAKVIANASVSLGTTLSRVDLYVDGTRMKSVSGTHLPAILAWNTATVGDGPHELKVRATDAHGIEGQSGPVLIWVENSGACGCSSDGGRWEMIGLIVLLAVIRGRSTRARLGSRQGAAPIKITT